LAPKAATTRPSPSDDLDDLFGIEKLLDFDTLKLLAAIQVELLRAEAAYPPMHSAHEGLAVIMEEFEELKALVWAKQSRHDRKAMRREAIQIAAMSLRFIKDVCDKPATPLDRTDRPTPTAKRKIGASATKKRPTAREIRDASVSKRAQAQGRG
jgi:hypothetical protein